MKFSLTILALFIVIPVYSMDLLSKVILQPGTKCTEKQDKRKMRKSVSLESVKYGTKDKNSQPLLLIQNESKNLSKAIKKNDVDLVRQALSQGVVALNFQEKKKGRTFLMQSLINIRKYVKKEEVQNKTEYTKAVEIFKLLLAKEDKQDIFTTDKKGKDVMEYAEKHNMSNIASIISLIQTDQATDFDKPVKTKA